MGAYKGVLFIYGKRHKKASTEGEDAFLMIDFPASF
jgi:hypothetical protein